MIPELSQYMHEHWTELRLPPPVPRRVSVLQVAGFGGAAAKVAFFVFPAGSGQPLAVAKSTRFPGHLAALQHEAEVLRTLCPQLPPALAATLPVLLSEFDLGPQHLILYRAAAGYSFKHLIGRPWLARRTRLLRQAARVCGDWIATFHQATRTGEVVLEGPTLAEEVEQPLLRYVEAVASPEQAEQVRPLIERTRAALAGAKVLLAQQHGDFWPGNVLWDGRQPAVLDWERSRPHSIPLGDPLFYLSSLAGDSIFTPRGGVMYAPNAFRQLWLAPSSLHTLVLEFLSGYARATGITPATLVWYLPVTIAKEAVRKATEAGGATWDDRWKRFFLELAARPEALDDLAGALWPRRRGREGPTHESLRRHRHPRTQRRPPRVAREFAPPDPARGRSDRRRQRLHRRHDRSAGAGVPGGADPPDRDQPGMPGGTDVGLRAATGELAVCLDDDLLLPDDALALFALPFDDDPRLAVAFGQVANYYTGDLDWWTYSKCEAPQQRCYTYTFPGGITALRLAALQDAGYYPDDFVRQCEELDLGYRLLDRGWRIMHLPEITCRHKESPGRTSAAAPPTSRPGMKCAPAGATCLGRRCSAIPCGRRSASPPPTPRTGPLRGQSPGAALRVLLPAGPPDPAPSRAPGRTLRLAETLKRQPVFSAEEYDRLERTLRGNAG